MTLTPSEICRTLGHEDRMEILRILYEGERCVSELVEHLGIRQPAVSQHLMRLRTEGLVNVRREGKFRFYSMA